MLNSARGFRIIFCPDFFEFIQMVETAMEEGIYRRTGGLFGQVENFIEPSSPLPPHMANQRPLQFTEMGSEELDSPVFIEDFPPARGTNVNNSNNKANNNTTIRMTYENELKDQTIIPSPHSSHLIKQCSIQNEKQQDKMSKLSAHNVRCSSEQQFSTQRNIVTQDADHGEVSTSTSNSEKSTSKNPEVCTPATLQFLQEALASEGLCFLAKDDSFLKLTRDEMVAAFQAEMTDVEDTAAMLLERRKSSTSSL
uniref:Uncharacterized protein n=1 Tax=Micrurus carvalhoi TaxID=3147026 RepID=A0A2H6NJV2_9SAUR